MSPAPAKVTRGEIVLAALDIISRRGGEALSLTAVAEAVGIRAPSLYKRFSNRAALMTEVHDRVLADLGRRMRDAQRHKQGAAAIKTMAGAYRAWGKREPRHYQLLHSASALAQSETANAAIEPVLEATTALVGERNALAAARLLTAFLHGFVTMENAGEFKMGGSIDAAFAFGLDAIIRGLETREKH